MSSRSLKRLVLAAGLLPAIVCIWWLACLFSRTDNEARDVILISIDTIRADHLSGYGYEHKTSPRIDSFAGDAVLFENCFVNIPLTLPSHSSMFTGLIPPAHGVQDNFDMDLPEDKITLAELLKAEGYYTYGIISAEVLNKKYGIGQGFDVYDDSFDSETTTTELVDQRRGDETVGHALKWLEDNREKKKFMFIHFYDPHHEYMPPEPYDKQFEHPYDGEIAFVDHCIGQIIDKLKTLDLYDESLIIITGDHGELLGEHGESGHGFFIYNNALHVPLIIKPADHSKPMRIKDNTSLVDIFPTVLGQCDIEIPGHVQGVDLSGYFTSESHRINGRYIFNECLTATKYNGNSLLGVINDQWHYIQTTRPELYDRINDPQELNNLISQESQRARILREHLREILDSSVQNTSKPDRDDNKSLGILESLGYVGGDIDTDLTFVQDKEDPKDLLEIHNSLQKGLGLVGEGKFTEAIKQCNTIMQQRSDIPLTYDVLADIYIKLESYDKAIGVMQKKLALEPEDIDTIKYLAETYDLAGDYSHAIEYTEQVVKLKPDDAEAYRKLGGIYLKLKLYNKAVEAMQRHLVLAPEDVEGLKFLAETCSLTKDYTQAIDYISMILKLEGDAAETYYYLARNYHHLNDSSRAIQSYLKSLELDGGYVSARIDLADTYKQMGKLKEAVEQYEAAIRQDDKLAVVHNSLAWIQATQKGNGLYDPESALIHAEKAVELSMDENSATHGYYPYFLDVLAIAQSANGQNAASIETATLALKLRRQKENTAIQK